MQTYLILVRDRLWSTLDALLPVRDVDTEARVALASRREPVFREIASPASPWAGRRRAVGRRGQAHIEAA